MTKIVFNQPERAKKPNTMIDLKTVDFSEIDIEQHLNSINDLMDYQERIKGFPESRRSDLMKAAAAAVKARMKASEERSEFWESRNRVHAEKAAKEANNKAAQKSTFPHFVELN